MDEKCVLELKAASFLFSFIRVFHKSSQHLNEFRFRSSKESGFM